MTNNQSATEIAIIQATAQIMAAQLGSPGAVSGTLVPDLIKHILASFRWEFEDD